jgi:hypothetical protein
MEEVTETTIITSTSTQEEIFTKHKVSLKDVNIAAWETLERYTLDTYLVSDYFQENCTPCTCTDENGVEECTFEGEYGCCNGFDTFYENKNCHQKDFSLDENGDLDLTELNPCNVDSFTIGLFYSDLT